MMSEGVKISLQNSEICAVVDRRMLGLCRYIWYLHGGYAVRSERGKKRKMEWDVFGDPMPGMVVDHKNGDRLDNRRQNLRWATPGQNVRNLDLPNRETGFLGVTMIRRKGLVAYQGVVRVDGVPQKTEVFDCAIAAAKARDEILLRVAEMYGVYNFPKKELGGSCKVSQYSTAELCRCLACQAVRRGTHAQNWPKTM